MRSEAMHTKRMLHLGARGLMQSHSAWAPSSGAEPGGADGWGGDAGAGEEGEEAEGGVSHTTPSTTDPGPRGCGVLVVGGDLRRGPGLFQLAEGP